MMNFYFNEFCKVQSFCRILDNMGIDHVLLAQNPNANYIFVVITSPSNTAKDEYDRIQGGAEVDR